MMCSMIKCIYTFYKFKKIQNFHKNRTPLILNIFQKRRGIFHRTTLISFIRLTFRIGLGDSFPCKQINQNRQCVKNRLKRLFEIKYIQFQKISCWLQRLYKDAILKNINPILKPEGLGFLFVKLGRVKKGFQVTQKEIQDAVKNVLALKQLFKRLIAFIDEPKPAMRM